MLFQVVSMPKVNGKIILKIEFPQKDLTDGYKHNLETMGDDLSRYSH